MGEGGLVGGQGRGLIGGIGDGKRGRGGVPILPSGESSTHSWSLVYFFSFTRKVRGIGG